MKKSKRTLTLLLAMIITLSLMPIATSTQPSDMNPSHYSHPMDIIPISGAPVAPVFFDDFTKDTLFWDINMVSMRRYNDKLVSNVNNGWSRAETRSRLWDNFTAEIDFTFTSEHREGIDGFAVFHIRYTGPNINLGILIRDTRISVIRNWDFIEQHIAHHDFTRGEMHSLKIEAQDEYINLFVWCNDYNDFIQLNNAPIIYGTAGQPPQAGRVVLRSWLDHIAVDSVRITDTNPPEFFFVDSFVRAEMGDENPPAIFPVNNTGYAIDSISFISSKPDIISVNATTGVITAHRQYMDTVVITSTATMTNGEKFTAQYHAVVYAPFTGDFSFKLHDFQSDTHTLRVGDTLNLNLHTKPVYVSDIQFTWETTHPNAIEIVGNTPISRGIRALAPANNITVRATHQPSGDFRETTIHVLPAITTPVDRVFTLDNVPRAIPEYFFGMNLGQAVGFINGFFHARDPDSYNRVLDAELEVLRNIQPQIVRYILEHYDSENHEIYGIIGTHNQNSISQGNYNPVPLSAVFRQADELGVPLFFTTSTRHTAAEKIELISAARNIVDSRPLFVTIMNEPHDPTDDIAHMAGRNPPATVQDYMDIVREVSTTIRAMYDDVIISVCSNPDAFMWANPADIDIPGTLAHRLITWNEYLALPENRQYFDAVVMFAYSGGQVPAFFGGVTTDSIMESFSLQAARELKIIERQSYRFPDQEIWVVEFGDLPNYHFPHGVVRDFQMCERIRARWQYMKSLGNAIGYVQRQLGMLRHGEATMAIYYSFNHAGSFGVVQTDYDALYLGNAELVTLPSYYAFSEMGRIFNEHTHFYPLTPPAGISYPIDVWFGGWPGSAPLTGTIPLDVYRLSGLAFGNDEGATQVVFVNTSATPANISIPSYSFRKTWSFGDGSNPLPDFAVNQIEDWGDPPFHVPVPQVHAGDFSETLVVTAYSMVVADIKHFSLRDKLAALIVKAQTLLDDTRVSMDGSNIPTHEFWANQDAHNKFLAAILEAIDVLEDYDAQANPQSLHCKFGGS